MRQVDGGHKEVGDADEEVAGIVEEPAGVPEDGEHQAGDNDAEDLGQGMEKEVTVDASQMESGEGQQCEHGGPARSRQRVSVL